MTAAKVTKVHVVVGEGRDIVEDYFMTYDGEPFPAFSQVISIS